jgi:SAM-dependent methyltransferase
MYDDVITVLRETYNSKAAERDTNEIADWKIAERQHFLSLLQAEGKRRVLEIGAGPGKDSLFFKENGLDVTCTDLSPEMVKLCQAKGLTAYTMDFLNLGFPAASFDAVYALNCLLHVPKSDLGRVLENIRRLLKPGGLFFLGVYGGHDFEGIWEEDRYTPQRFFSFYSDEDIQKVVAVLFTIRSFKPIATGGDGKLHFQSLILQRP